MYKKFIMISAVKMTPYFVGGFIHPGYSCVEPWHLLVTARIFASTISL